MKTLYKDYLGQNSARQLDELIEWLQIKSISALPNHLKDMQKGARWIASHLKNIGLENISIIEPEDKPLVYADWLNAGPDKPTVLFYGHYDVVPTGPLEKWENPPFEPEIRYSSAGEEIVARGVADDKGQVFAHVKALEAMLATEGELPVNVKLLIEGEEEVGSKIISKYVSEHKDKLVADACIVSDTSMAAADRPSIDYGLRGIWCGELIVKGPAGNLHSGGFGGIIHNPLQALCQMLATVHDGDGAITIDGFLDDVRVIPSDERADLISGASSDNELKKAAGVKELWGDPNFTPAERIGARPTFEINGLVGGHTEEGVQTIIPTEARAKLSCRLVPFQKPETIETLLKAHFAKTASSAITWRLESIASLPAALIDRDSKAMQAASVAYESAFGKAPAFTLCGGGIPIVNLFQDVLDLDVVLMGLGLPSDNCHGPNERMLLSNFYKGIQTSIAFMEEFAKG